LNLAPDLTTGMAIAMSLTAAFMWGSWFIAIKYLDDYPLEGFYVTLFATSVVFVWVVGFLLDGPALLANLRSVGKADPSRVTVTLLCGALYVIGLQMSVSVSKLIGLSLSQPIQTSMSILVGTLMSALVGGLPQGFSVLKIALGCLFLIAAVAASMLAGKFRSQTLDPQQNKLQFSMQDLWKGLGLLVISALLMPAYTLGASYGLKSVTQPNGLAVMPFMALLASGAFIGSMLSSGLLLTLRKQWPLVLHAGLKLHKLGVLAGLFHYGGNIIHTFATASLSTVIAWPLGMTSGLWTQLWGLAYGEFKGAPRRSYWALAAAVMLYFIGAYIVTLMI
jgi:drug/metabolite transporter (DMT)-like permease